MTVSSRLAGPWAWRRGVGRGVCDTQTSHCLSVSLLNFCRWRSTGATLSAGAVEAVTLTMSSWAMNSTMAVSVIRRSFQKLDGDTFVPLYKALVRTHLDYACCIWSPYKQKYKDALENVQRRATKLINGMSEMSYSGGRHDVAIT